MSMLTIKHVENCGVESIRQAKSVSYFPEGGRGIQNGPEGQEPIRSKATLEAFGCTDIGGAVDPSGHCTYGDGLVYVMNEGGATVGKYVL